MNEAARRTPIRTGRSQSWPARCRQQTRSASVSMSRARRGRARSGRLLLWLGLALLAASGASASGSVDAAGPIGHPRQHLPLAVYLAPPRRRLGGAGAPRGGRPGTPVTPKRSAWRRCADWTGKRGADVVIRVVAAARRPAAWLRASGRGRRGRHPHLPVRIDPRSSRRRWARRRGTVLFQVAAHEVGHALGLSTRTTPDRSCAASTER